VTSAGGAAALVLTAINGGVSIPSDNTARSFDRADQRAGSFFIVVLHSKTFQEPSIALRWERFGPGRVEAMERID
jgi:hypothetical protein